MCKHLPSKARETSFSCSNTWMEQQTEGCYSRQEAPWSGRILQHPSWREEQNMHRNHASWGSYPMHDDETKACYEEFNGIRDSGAIRRSCRSALANGISEMSKSEANPIEPKTKRSKRRKYFKCSEANLKRINKQQRMIRANSKRLTESSAKRNISRSQNISDKKYINNLRSLLNWIVKRHLTFCPRE